MADAGRTWRWDDGAAALRLSAQRGPLADEPGFLRAGMLASRDETVVAEDRNVTGMLRNRRLAQSRSDQSLGRVRQPLGSKTAWRGGRLLSPSASFPAPRPALPVGR
jgi:hypothetical protein